MNIIDIKRIAYTPFGTYGVLTVGDFSCVTIEKPWLNNQLRVSCIPTGEYWAFKRKSPSRTYEVIELRDVPGRTNIQIHIANLEQQLLGCIAPGMEFWSLSLKHDGENISGTGVARSALAFSKIMDLAPARLQVNITDDLEYCKRCSSDELLG